MSRQRESVLTQPKRAVAVGFGHTAGMVTAQRPTSSKLRAALSRVGRILARVWKVSNGVRVAILNVVFFAIIIALLVLVLKDSKPDFADSNALVLAPKGTIVEQLSADGPSLSGLVTGGPGAETLLRDMVETIERAGDDDRIDVLVLDLAELDSAGISKQQELAAAITAFRGKGKPVIATADHYSQARQFFISQTSYEQAHIASALVFELSKVEHLHIRVAMVAHLLQKILLPVKPISLSRNQAIPTRPP